MNETLSKIKEFISGHRYFIIFAFIVAVIAAYCFMSGAGNGEDVSSNGNTADAIRGELEQAQGAEQHITDAADAIKSTVGGLADTIENAANASNKFEAILDECAGIIDAIRNQPAE